jgi:hypothetical protein
MERMRRRRTRHKQLLDDLKVNEYTGIGKRKHWDALGGELEKLWTWH